mmetsp:Transcript_62959/g.159778  ORF Transcript_62959/g.159778 Transcript_62959/m.159778 type:complete len:207 (-) Transcript_62959:94-714(-)
MVPGARRVAAARQPPAAPGCGRRGRRGAGFEGAGAAGAGEAQLLVFGRVARQGEALRPEAVQPGEGVPEAAVAAEGENRDHAAGEVWPSRPLALRGENGHRTAAAAARTGGDFCGDPICPATAHQLRRHTICATAASLGRQWQQPYSACAAAAAFWSWRAFSAAVRRGPPACSASARLRWRHPIRPTAARCWRRRLRSTGAGTACW